MSNVKSLEVNVAISQKKLNCMIFDQKNDRKRNERKSWELTVWILQKENKSMFIQKVPNIATCALQKKTSICLLTKIVLTYNLRFSESVRISVNSPLVSTNPPLQYQITEGSLHSFLYAWYVLNKFNKLLCLISYLNQLITKQLLWIYYGLKK